jgi:hypothetical protein
MRMSTVKSKDGTVIAYDQAGSGPAVVIVGGVLGDRSQQAPLAALLAPHFTVFNYDRVTVPTGLPEANTIVLPPFASMPLAFLGWRPMPHPAKRKTGAKGLPKVQD